MRLPRQAWFGVAALAAAQPAHAQTYDVGPQAQFRRDHFNEKALGDDATWRVVEIVANCMAAQNPKTTFGLLATLPLSPAETAAFLRSRRFVETCMRPALRLTPGRNGVGLTLPPFGFRGYFAEALLRRQPGWHNGPPPGAEANLMRHFERAPGAATLAAANRNVFVFYDLASCAVAREWTNTSAFLATAPRSPEEKAALKGLAETISACLQPDVKIAVEPRSFRGVLAEATLYALAADRYPVGDKHLRN